MNKILRVALCIAVVVLMLAISGCSSNYVSTSTPQDSLAPEFQLSDLNGQLVTLSDLRDSPVLLNFWASWCGPCRLENPFFQDIYENEVFSDKGLVILAVNIGEDFATANKFMVDNGLSFTVLLDTDGKVTRKYNVRVIPTTFFIDRNGMVRAVKVGAFSSRAEAEQHLNNSIIN